MAKTLYEKLFDAHVVYEAPDETPLLHIDRHLVHEVTSPQAFDGLRAHGAGASTGENLCHDRSQRLHPD
ncbi:hypothetical protein ACNKHS_00510 [Shigella flexneri]